MSTSERPEIGATIDANGVKTNILEAGEGAPVVLVHGSGPGVTGYANWRLTMPVLAERFRVDVVPTLILVKDRRAVSRLDGRTSAPKIEAMLEPHLRQLAAA